MQDGLFIVLDGNDGSGKATQTKMLVEHFVQSGVPTEKIDFPGYQERFFGKLIAECLAGEHGDFVHMDPKIASTLYALDRQEAAPKIREWLQEGKMVISDRYASSNMIHQGGKIEDEEDRINFLSWLDTMEYEIVGIPRPHAVIYLDVPVAVSLELLEQKRAAKNHTLKEDKDTVEKDRQYLERSHISARALAASEPTWHIISCTKDGVMRSPEEIHEEILTLVLQLRAR